ncbi:MAG: class I SAM-dependent methyltransferase [Flavobacteriaceae bacterium]|nr:class I SAM-dependent methyltransferase [Flavobacteriaceae bacterium]
MNHNLLLSEIQSFIRSYEGELSDLAFKGSPFEDVTVQELMQQVDGFRRTKKKLPLWHKTRGIYYPPKLNLEQSSSEATGKYKAGLVGGKSLLDITGGFGVDSFYFSDSFEEVIYVEQHKNLYNIVTHNFRCLGKETIHSLNDDGLTLLNGKSYDVIYADPGRRDKTNGKVFMLSQCEPNVLLHLDQILTHCDKFLLKTSPMLDISRGILELKFVHQVHVVAIENEVKELLWILQNKPSEKIVIRTINMKGASNQHFDFEYVKSSPINFGAPQNFLYEPNAAIMKSGGYLHISEQFGLWKLHVNSHLFTGNDLIEFPGRRFLINQVFPYQKSILKDRVFKRQAHVSTRNFPLSVRELRSRWKIGDGGERYLFFTLDKDDKKIVLDCSRKI